jgi:hypothetical protein
MQIPKPIITREHGSWAVLIVPMIVALSFTGTVQWNNVCLALSTLSVFMCYVPAHNIFRRRSAADQSNEKLRASYLWGSIYLCVGFIFIVPLFLQRYLHLISLTVLGTALFLVNYALTVKGKKNIISDLAAVAGLTLTAPSMYYISTGSIDVNAFILWLLNFLFFGSSVFYVHMKIKATGLKKEHISFRERLILGKMNMLYHIAAAGIIAAMTIVHYVTLTVVFAFTPMFIHVFYGTLTLSTKVRFKRLGVLLLAHSVIFSILLVIAWS